MLEDHPGDAMCQDTRLAAARAGQDQQRPRAVHHGLALRGVQVLERPVHGGVRRVVHEAAVPSSSLAASVTRNVVPAPGSDATSSSEPPWFSSTIRLASERPTPQP